MTSVIKYYEGINSVSVIGNYLPRQCGIATFTTSLVEALSAEAPDINCWVTAVNDNPDGYPYPYKVRFEMCRGRFSSLDLFCYTIVRILTLLFSIYAISCFLGGNK